MTIRWNNIYNKLDDQLHVIQASVYNNKQVTEERKKYTDVLNKKLNKHESIFDDIKTPLKQVIVQNKTSYPDRMNPQKAQDITTVVPDNNKAPLLEVGHYTKFGPIWHLKH